MKITTPLLGAHTSIAGGVSLSVSRAAQVGFTAAQIFVKNNKQWFAPPLALEEIRSFHEARAKSGIYFVGHNGYLINLANANDEAFAKSVQSMVEELKRAEALELPFLVMHPGSHGGSGEERGLQRIVEGLEKILREVPFGKTKLALENTAGQGSGLGHRFEHLAYLLEHVSVPERFGVCLDTAHLFAAGYDLRDEKSYMATMAEFDRIVGKKWVLGFHLNDSKVPLGKRVDRHEHLGQGHIGLEGFRCLMQDKQWLAMPKILETPKSEDMHEDVENLSRLKRLL